MIMEIMGVVFLLTFTAAFNTVNHSILLRKINHEGIRGIPIHCFESYLSNRK